MARDKFAAGTAIKITSTIKDADNVLTTPTSCTITIRKGSETPVVAAQSMSEESTGVMTYVWQSATSTPEGIYGVTTAAVYSGYTSIEETEDLIYLKS
ncbi:MAG: hypothetical protein ACYSR9_05775 [Planctomycetota bacterium]|jgi:hypothetical protein